MSKEAMKPRMNHQRLYYLVLIGLGIISMIVSQTTQLSNAQAPLLAEVFRAMDWSSDGRFIATARQDGRIEIWDTDGQLLRSWQADTSGPTIALSWHPDSEGTLLASGGADTIVRVWDAETGNLIREFPGHNDFVTSVFWSPDGTKLGSTGFNSIPANILIWSFATGESLLQIQGGDSLQDGIWAPDGEAVATARGFTIELWGSTSGTLQQSFDDFRGIVVGIDWASTSNLVAGAALDSTIWIYDATSGNLVRTLTGHQHFHIDSAKWHPDGIMLASASADGTVRIWNTNTGEQLAVIQVADPATEKIPDIAWSPDGNWLAYGIDDLTFKIVPTSSLVECDTNAGSTSSADGVEAKMEVSN